MDMDPGRRRPTIGETVAARRRTLGLTQEALAEAAGLSVETVRKLEQGERNSPRMSTLRRLATALHVPTSALLGSASQAAARREPDFDQVALLDLRRTLTPARGLHGTLVGAGEPPLLGDVAMSVRALDIAYHDDDYARTLEGLPAVIGQARAVVIAAGSDTDVGHAHELHSQSLQVAGTLLIQLRQLDLAYQALTAALDAADRSGNDLIGGSVITTLCWLFLRQGRLDETERLAVTTADQIEPRFSRAEDPVRYAEWGWLMLRASAAAARDARYDDAEAMLDAAAAAAVRLGDRGPLELSPGPAKLGTFCPATVAMKRVEAAVIAGDPLRVLALAGQVPPTDLPRSNNWNRHRLDVAWAHAERRQWSEARDVLTGIARTAPAWLRHQRFARDVVESISKHRRRAMDDELTELAALVGL
jgi:transcriptional regulator with XRE-family HTH domain